MAIIYSLQKSLDKVELSVSQITLYKLMFEDEVLETSTLQTNSEVVLNTTIDGEYTLILESAGEPSETEIFKVVRNLQHSLSKDVVNVICMSKSCSCAQQIETAQNIINKIFYYHAIYLPEYGKATLTEFNAYLQAAVELDEKCITSTIRKIIREDNVLNTNETNLQVLKKFIYIYWAGFYFLELQLIDQSNLDLVTTLKDVFCYKKVVNCSCGLCFSMEELKNLYNSTNMYSFQFDDISKNITNVDEIDEVYLNTVATLESQAELLNGKDIEYSNLGRLGFAIRTNVENQYDILDVLNNVITTSTFDRYYDSVNEIEYFVSKEYIVPSTIYFKFKFK